MKYNNSSKNGTKHKRTEFAKWTSIMRKLSNQLEKDKQREKVSK